MSAQFLQTKSRMIAEFRYPPAMGAFDSRGKILKKITSTFDEMFPHWQADNVAINFSDNTNLPSRRIQIDHHRAFIYFEDLEKGENFEELITTFALAVKDIFNDEFSKINRLGIRLISILESGSLESFESANDLIMTKYFSPNIPLSISPKDCRATLAHDNGLINIGPMRKDEQWTREMFSLQDQNIPEYGIGLDVDTFSNNLDFSTEAKIRERIQAVINLAKLTEKEVVQSLQTDTE